MKNYYSNEKNTQMLIALLKANNIKKIVASPGATNVCFVASVQSDDFFDIYSSVDERSAAYIACGMAADSGEPVVLSCTGATASRNYLSGLTEAFYRHLPILAVTATQHLGRIGNHIPQVIDRTSPLNDTFVFNAEIPTVHDEEDEWAYGVMMNKAIIALTENGGGPVHIDLTTAYSKDFSVKDLPNVNVIRKYAYESKFPEIEAKKIAIFVGAHAKWSERLTKAVDSFCEKYNSVVFFDHTSNYTGKYGSLFNLVAGQNQYDSANKCMDLLIHIGDISGAYLDLKPKNVWRVNIDGEIRDTFRHLTAVFQTSEEFFFETYSNVSKAPKCIEYYTACQKEYNFFLSKLKDLPYSNAWVARELCSKIPANSILYLGILNSLRSWNFFYKDSSIESYSNTGGFGIDGILSSAIGVSFSNKSKIIYCILGDLSFFYDMNSIGNRHVGNNLRILIINNGIGTEFKNYSHPAARFGDDADLFMAARGHYGNKSERLIKHYAEDLGMEYICAHNKNEFVKNEQVFLDPQYRDRSIVYEVFTDSVDESNALYIINNLEVSKDHAAKKVVKGFLGEKGMNSLKKLIKG